MIKRRQISQSERLALKKAWGNACAYCEKPIDSFEVDHIVAYARGGSCDLENLCVTCQSCNRRKRDTPLPEFYEGLLLSLAKRKASKVRGRFRKSQVKLPLNPICPARAVFGDKYVERYLIAEKSRLIAEKSRLTAESKALDKVRDDLRVERDHWKALAQRSVWQKLCGNKYVERYLKKSRGQTQYVLQDYVNGDLFKITKAGANVKRGFG